jgi:solute carrier family 35, member F5
MRQYIFSDNSFSKPFFVVYINTSIFAVSLIPMVLKHVAKHGIEGTKASAKEIYLELRYRKKTSKARTPEEDLDPDAGERLLVSDDGVLDESAGPGTSEKLSLGDTAWLSLEFCMLWFAANYFASACLEYTSVGSVTIFTSLSSMFTLMFGALMRVERFTARKLLGVLASLAGVVLISTVDLSGQSDENRGNFPHKSQLQIAIGDSMALFSAVVYGVYVTVMKSRVGNEDRVNMPLFFGLVGLINVLALWPGFFILHWIGVEKVSLKGMLFRHIRKLTPEQFEMPPSGKIWAIILANSVSSFVSDMSWAYAMLLTTPLVVTVGLSLTIPLSLIGEMIQYAQYSSWVYWVGACVVVLSFLFINHESHEEGGKGGPTSVEQSPQSNGDGRGRSAEEP